MKCYLSRYDHCSVFGFKIFSKITRKRIFILVRYSTVVESTSLSDKSSELKVKKKLLRGHQVRQEMTNGETEEVAATEETTETKNEAEEVIDIDLNDPQTEEAAVKIQVSH